MWDNCHRAMQEQIEAKRRGLASVFSEERRWPHVINHSSSFAGLRGGSPPGPSGLESTKCTTCLTLGSDENGEMVTVAEYKAWAFHTQARYETNSMAIPKKNSDALASIGGKPAQVAAVCVPIELELGSDGIQKIAEVLDAYFGVESCDSMGVAEGAGRIQLPGVVIDHHVSGGVFIDQKAMLSATTNRDMSFSSVQVALQNSFADSQGSVWSRIRSMELALPLEKAKTPIGRVGTRVVPDVAGEVMVDLHAFVAAMPVASLLIVGRRLGTKVARASPLLLMLRKCKQERRINWSLKTHRRNVGVPMLGCTIHGKVWFGFGPWSLAKFAYRVPLEGHSR